MIGGIETMVQVLATELTSRGHEVCVLCSAKTDSKDDFAFQVVRNASMLQTIRWWRWSDVILHVSVSLKGLWPFLIVRRPWFISHQSWYCAENQCGVRARLKLFLARTFATRNIAISHAIAEHIGTNVVIIPNCYDRQTFKQRDEIDRDRDILFVGRLVSDKGCDTLLKAIQILKSIGLSTSATIVGSGPSEGDLKSLATQLGIESLVTFTGALRGEALSHQMNAHRYLVVPSRWKEPFGIVALEGIASGCYVIGSAHGGLKDAIGNCGRLFENGNEQALADALQSALKDSSVDNSQRIDHLARFTASSVAAAYEDTFADPVEQHHLTMPKSH